MRMGKVRFADEFIVDLDNERQVDIATDFILEDIRNAVKHDEELDWIVQDEDATLTEKDIHPSILEELKFDEAGDG